MSESKHSGNLGAHADKAPAINAPEIITANSPTTTEVAAAETNTTVDSPATVAHAAEKAVSAASTTNTDVNTNIAVPVVEGSPSAQNAGDAVQNTVNNDQTAAVIADKAMTSVEKKTVSKDELEAGLNAVKVDIEHLQQDLNQLEAKFDDHSNNQHVSNDTVVNVVVPNSQESTAAVQQPTTVVQKPEEVIAKPGMNLPYTAV